MGLVFSTFNFLTNKTAPESKSVHKKNPTWLWSTCNTNCDKIDVNAAAFLKGVDKKVKEFKEEISNLATENVGLNESLKKNAGEQTEEVKKIVDAKENITKEKAGIQTKEADIDEGIKQT